MGWSRFFRRAKWDRERLEEIDSYLQIETDENIARGMPPEEARAAARRKLGNRTLAREEIYVMNTLPFFDGVARETRHALRSLRRNPMFAAIALLTIAIGVGANTAVFSVLNSVILRPLPYPNAEELVGVWHSAPGAEGLTSISGDLRLSASMFFTYAEQNRTFQSMGIWSPFSAAVTGLAEPEQVRVVSVSDGALAALAVQPALGRWFSAEDQTPGGPRTVMLGYGYWQRRFGGEESAIGKTVMLDSRPREIVGVMPEGFRFVDDELDLIVPMALDRSQLRLAGFGFRCVARLKPGVTIPEAGADIARLLPVWMDSWPAPPGIDPHVYDNWRIGPAIRPLAEDVVGNVADVIWVLMGTIGIVMLIACANVANLLLVRAESRRQELSVRAALGAGWGRIARAFLLESVLLGLLGGALGLGLAHAGLRFLVALGPGNLPRLHEISLDGRALAFTAAISLLSGLLFGLIPVLRYSRPLGAKTLLGASRTATQSRERHRTRNALVVGQLALALVLVVTSGLMIRTFLELRAVDPGITRAAQIQTVRTSIPNSLIQEPERVIRQQHEILDNLAAIPGVASVAFASEMPLQGIFGNWDVIITEGQPPLAAEIPPIRIFRSVSPGFFSTLGTRLVAGREYTWTDLYESRPFAIVSENLARELWGEPGAALGRRISTALPGAPWREVIGVVQDVRNNGVQEAAPAIVYWPSFGEDIYPGGAPTVQRTISFAIRSDRAGTESFLQQVQAAMWSVNPSLPLASVQTMQDIYDKSLARTSFTLVMLTIAGAMALALGIIGIYGVISYVVSQRKREIGIRVALGAQRGEVRWMFVRYGLTLASVGVTLGLAAAAGLTRLMSSLLFGVSPLDPLTYAAAPLVLAAAAVLASCLPAQRAASANPVESLRAE
jgi:predicted permease